MKKKVIMMKKKSWVTVACLATLFFACVSFKTYTNSVNDTNRIVGVWKIVSPALSGGEEQQKIKIITKDRFIWTHTFNSAIIFSLGGVYSFDGDTYIENIEFGTPNQKTAFGRKVVYKVRFEDKKMHIIGGYENDSRVFNETWERVE